VRFSPDGRHLFVADAGSPHVHVHARDGGAWHGVHYPVASVRVMDDDVFGRGRYNCREGGPKGVDVDRTGRMLVVTAECQPLACVDVTDLRTLAPGEHLDPDHDLRYELGVVEAAGALVGERVGELERQLTTITTSRSYRLARQLRRLESLRPRRRR
jgi:hypothetical protein